MLIEYFTDRRINSELSRDQLRRTLSIQMISGESLISHEFSLAQSIFLQIIRETSFQSRFNMRSAIILIKLRLLVFDPHFIS